MGKPSYKGHQAKIKSECGDFVVSCCKISFCESESDGVGDALSLSQKSSSTRGDKDLPQWSSGNFNPWYMNEKSLMRTDSPGVAKFSGWPGVMESI
jgi:hypothetical protein